MLIIDAIITRASNKLHLWIARLENCKSGDWSTLTRRSSTVSSLPRERRCALGWKPGGMRAGSSDCWRN